MFMVVIGTFEWSSLSVLRKIPKTDAFVIILVSAITVITLTGLSGDRWCHCFRPWVCLGIKQIHRSDEIRDNGTKVFLHGPLFFASVTDFNLGFSPQTDPDSVIVDMKESRVWDHSGLEAIHKLGERYKVGKALNFSTSA